ncbi:hypothetical protein Q4S45_17540 [Massilia sp. R2A-15]|nr:hypothetical protein [Massilia sp. R2A-15]WLI88515.1 hypothetical protein Q4S45_17540 [Massilia sp. R2A-15]
MKPSLRLRILILLGYVVLCTALVLVEQADGPAQSAQASVEEPE